VVSERLGHANVAFTMQTYQHLLPGMQADAARTTERLARPAPPPPADTVERRRKIA
jgi:integrase